MPDPMSVTHTEPQDASRPSEESYQTPLCSELTPGQRKFMICRDEIPVAEEASSVDVTHQANSPSSIDMSCSVEALGEVLHGLSARLLIAGAFNNDAVHAAYEKVVSVFEGHAAGLSHSRGALASIVADPDCCASSKAIARAAIRTQEARPEAVEAVRPREPSPHLIEAMAWEMARVIAYRHGGNHKPDDWMGEERREEARAAYNALSEQPRTDAAGMRELLQEARNYVESEAEAATDDDGEGMARDLLARTDQAMGEGR